MPRSEVSDVYHRFAHFIELATCFLGEEGREHISRSQPVRWGARSMEQRDRLLTGVLDNTIAHADDKEQEKGEGVSSRIQDCNYYHESFSADCAPVSIHEVVETPRHEHFDNYCTD
jgi:hypothetical protein